MTRVKLKYIVSKDTIAPQTGTTAIMSIERMSKTSVFQSVQDCIHKYHPNADTRTFELLKFIRDTNMWILADSQANITGDQLQLVMFVSGGTAYGFNKYLRTITYSEPHVGTFCVKDEKTIWGGTLFRKNLVIHIVHWSEMSRYLYWNKVIAIKVGSRANPERIRMKYIYPLDIYKQRKAALHENIMKHLFHPSRIGRWIESGNAAEDYMP